MVLAELSWWAPLLQTVVGAVIGAIGAIGGGAFASWFAWQKERQAVAAALAGEVQGLIDVFEWVEARELIPKGYVFPIDERPFPVVEANVGKIGSLPADLAGKVTGFYGYARGIVQNFAVLRTGEPMRDPVEFRDRFVKGLDTLKDKAEALVPELQKEASMTWLDYLEPT